MMLINNSPCIAREPRPGRWATLLVAVLLLGAASLAQAVPLGLTQTYPDFTVSSLSYSFTTDGDGGQLSISGSPGSFTQVAGGDQDPVFGGSFQLKADIDGSGNVLSGSFDLDGVVRDLNNLTTILYDGSTDKNGLLGGNLSAFGYSGSGATGILEFSFAGIDGLLETLLGPLAGGGMILSLSSSTLTDFDKQLLTSNWYGKGFGDVFATVPEPAAFWLIGSGGLIVLLGSVIRRKR